MPDNLDLILFPPVCTYLEYSKVWQPSVVHPDIYTERPFFSESLP